MSIEAFVQITAAFAFVGGAAYWGGQVKNAICRLSEEVTDHEHRLRRIEHGVSIPID